MPEDVFETKLTWVTTRNGAKFYDGAHVWTGMSYDAMQTLQGAVIRSVLELGDARMEPVAAPRKK